MDIKLLIKNCIRGKARDQELFYDRYSGLVMGICIRYTKNEDQAADVFQEAFIKIFKNLSGLKNPEAVVSWIRSLTVRVALDHLKMDRFPVDRAVQDFDTSDNYYEKLLDSLSEEVLIGVINELPDGYRAVFNLYVVDGYSHQEIAQELGITESTSRSQLTHARNLLREKLRKLGITMYESVI